VEQLPPHPVSNPHDSGDQPGPANSPKPWYRRWWAIALAAVIVVGGFSAAVNGDGDEATATSENSTSAKSTEKADSKSQEPPTPTPVQSSTSASPKPSVTTSSPAPTPIPTPTPTEEPDKPANPADYEKLNARDLALISKNPDSHLGRQVKVYANITQFDAATGDCIFRGNTAHTNMADSWDYEHNSLFMGEGGIGCEPLTEYVADDEVLVLATVGPSFSYDTQIGGSTTVPTYFVDGIELVQ
jgi:hypothetical protein